MSIINNLDVETVSSFMWVQPRYFCSVDLVCNHISYENYFCDYLDNYLCLHLLMELLSEFSPFSDVLKGKEEGMFVAFSGEVSCRGNISFLRYGTLISYITYSPWRRKSKLSW